MAQPSQGTGSQKPNLSSKRTVDDIPFSLLADLYRDLRSLNIGTSTGKSNGTRATKGNKRNAMLSKAWLTFADHTDVAKFKSISQSSDNSFIPAHIFPPSEAIKLISLMVPTLDIAHAYLGMKESKIADIIIKALDLLQSSPDAQWLKHFRVREYRPRKWARSTEVIDGNFASIVKAILKERCPAKSSLKIKHVWELLNVLSQNVSGRRRHYTRQIDDDSLLQGASDENKREIIEDIDDRKPDQLRLDAFRQVVQLGTAEEVSEVCRIIVKDLDMRLSDDNFFIWFHKDAKQHYRQVHDINKLLNDCHDPNYDVGDASIQLGRYASVMLTMRPSRKQLAPICEKLRGRIENSSNSGLGSFFMEPKLDGERMQLHKWISRDDSSNKVSHHIRTFTRRGLDSSGMYANALHDVIVKGVRADNVILDGEIMIWDVNKGSWLEFEYVRDVSTEIARKSISPGSMYKLKYMVFDILYVEQKAEASIQGQRKGSKVMQLPLFQRRQLLSKLICGNKMSYVPGVEVEIELVKAEEGRTEGELIETLQRYETLGYEGVIGKNPDARYCLAERNLEISIKLKPDYFDGGIQDLDVLILGGRYSSGSGHRKVRAGEISTFLIGIQASDPNHTKWKGYGHQWEQEMQRLKWIPIANVGTGYSDKELMEIRNKLEGQWKEFDQKDIPEHFTTFENRPYAPVLLKDVVFWVPPWKSIVLTIRAYELHRKLFTLRFPRVERINWEKPYYDVPSSYHLLDIDDAKLPATVRPDDDDADDISGLASRQRKKQRLDAEEKAAMERAAEEGHLITGGLISRQVMHSAMHTDVANIVQICKIYEGMSFFVITNDQQMKESLEIKIHELGGKFEQNLTTKTDYIVCTSMKLDKISSLIRKFQEKKDDSDVPIVLSDWVEECHTAKALKIPRLAHIIHVTRRLEKEWYEKYDRFGDDWKEASNRKGFEECLKQIDTWKKADGFNNTKFHPCASIKEQISSLRSRYRVFEGMKFYVPSDEILLKGSIVIVEAFGGSVTTMVEDDVTHNLIHSRNQDVRKRLSEKDIITIDEKWVFQCVHSKMNMSQ